MTITLIINEWLIHDLIGENGEKRRIESIIFLEKLIERCDNIAVLKDSSWMKKAYKLMKKSDPLIKRISKLLHLGILRDKNKTKIFNNKELKPLPSKLKEKVPKKDIYLVQIYIASEANLLITTDETFKNALSDGESRINVQLRDEFLSKYITN